MGVKTQWTLHNKGAPGFILFFNRQLRGVPAASPPSGASLTLDISPCSVRQPGSAQGPALG